MDQYQFLKSDTIILRYIEIFNLNDYDTIIHNCMILTSEFISALMYFQWLPYISYCSFYFLHRRS